jgi:hypothetical protein
VLQLLLYNLLLHNLLLLHLLLHNLLLHHLSRGLLPVLPLQLTRTDFYGILGPAGQPCGSRVYT